ncbi:TIGR04283 family arsenosugar biosynthesis glycosyltransferase [Zhongshania sp.]|uniref:TIGR04283 family arsenosugar biosynthesis glycosyltransferase n=1 Tax=Zhongshania sp. TaxID=1971902 RepID=UPI003561FDC1
MRVSDSDVVLSVIIPVLNEAEVLPSLLAELATQRAECQDLVEVIFVDGGSSDASLSLIADSGFRLLSGPRGRAKQMNFGAAAAAGSHLLFLHADTQLPECAFERVNNALRSGLWGRFDVRISGDAQMFKVIAWFMNWRSRLSGIATGDQGIFVRETTFIEVGGFPDQPLMEDIALSSLLRERAAPMCLRNKVETSGRRWQERGIWRTIILMWRLRYLYWRGVPAEQLASRYE